MKHIKAFLEYFRAFPAFSARDAKLFLRKSGAGSDYYKIFMHNMVKSGKAFSVGRGHYTLHDDPMMAGFVFSPFYYGMETALTHYKLWDYMTPISIVTTNRVRKGSIELLGRNASVRRIQKKKFWGYSMVHYKDNLYIPMADIEKTLIDSVYFHSRFDKEVYAKMAKRIDKKRLARYLKSYDGIINRQVGNLLKTAAQ
jgi:predicted transcriptional regulator of viral defense system